jgi:hypothetical protein
MMHDGPFLGLQGVHRAEIIGIGPDGCASIIAPDLWGETQVVAQSLVSVDRGSVGRQAAVVLMNDQPLILGLIQPPAPEIQTDGERLVLEARREVTLKCGKASIHLTADGRVTIRGTQLLSRSEGPNRIQGATVQLN